MERIAVLVGQIDEATQKKFLLGFIKQAYTYNYDVCVFTMHQKFQQTSLRDIGDSNIFELVNFEHFKAVIILSDTILAAGVAIPLQKRIKETFDGPVLVVDKESPYFESVIMDHYTPVKKIVDHLIEDHGYRKIAFLGGKEGHPHSVKRLNAYKDSLASHGIEIREEWIYHGNYWYDSAEDFVDILMKNRDDLPDALACANDFMAIGAAAHFEEYGLKVPEDIAITGYDSIEDGRNAPQPLTSADIPAKHCGEYTMHRLNSIINDEEMPDFEMEPELFIGGSCGCKFEVKMVPQKLREKWRTQQSSRSVFSDFNHILEDMLAQTSMRGLLETILDYTFQIKPFTSFDICLNEGFLQPNKFFGDQAIRKGYSDKIYSVLSCNESKDTEGKIDFLDSFDVGLMSPRIFEDRNYPTTFIFNALYFDDRCFGYTVLNYGREIKIYDESFRIWMRNIMQGIEAFYRQGYMFQLIENIKAGQIRDSLTGLYNYEGFIKRSETALKVFSGTESFVSIIAIDLKGTKQLNELHGRDVGDRAIKATARAIRNSVGENQVSCRLCNDEFLVALLDDDDKTVSKKFIGDVKEGLKSFRLFPESDYEIQFHSNILQGEPQNIEEFESLVNQTISIKNYAKNQSSQAAKETQDIVDELKRNQTVMRILDKNLLTYHYQPIVKVSDGSVYAFEALMRSLESDISPFHIIQSATYLNRLDDIERYTLLNVTEDFENNEELFGDAKIFINSLPGIGLTKEDDEEFSRRSLRHQGRFVVEFTEESELDDESLELIKSKYEHLGNQIAIDDYGAGYSNANNLLRYMPRYVKIDRMLISDIQNNPQKQHIVKHIIEFAHKNDVMALAEGVETSEELSESIRLGADLIQGYYTGKPNRIPVCEINPDIKMEISRAQAMQVSIGKSWRGIYI